MRRWWTSVIVACMVVVTPGCAQLLLGGLVAGQALAPISDEQEVAIGRSAAQEVLGDPGTPSYPNATLASYVQVVGMRVAQRSQRPTLPYEFHVIASSELNAFALPGGQIFVTTGALKAMKSETELAGVLAHEVTHVALRHGIDQLRRAMLAQGIAIAALGSTPALAQQAGKIALDLVLKGYSRTAEDEADRYGVLYSSAAGYDPQGLSSFLNTLAVTLGDTPKAFEPLSDHPIISERVKRISQIIAEQHLTGTEVGAEVFVSRTQPLR